MTCMGMHAVGSGHWGELMWSPNGDDACTPHIGLSAAVGLSIGLCCCKAAALDTLVLMSRPLNLSNSL